ncbi:craniofacial development protein 2-like, partial [Centruroides sculpturatus]|uniref:craniofacial development protein 2-like n=1 Tax=Centruroides sculpturatus TaxID=218467 RepID=UPI000C6E73CD
HGTLYYLGNNDQDQYHRNGVGIFVSAKHTQCVISHSLILDRLMILQIQGQLFKINIIQVYAPTFTNNNGDKLEDLYNSINKILGKLKKNDITVIIGDYNAKVGMGRREDLIGDFGLGLSIGRGDRLFEFCQENDMVITNTWFKLPKRRLYTWKSPADNNHSPIRNHIDYILVNKRHRNCITRVTTFPGADIGSDHVPLVADIKLKLKAIKPKCRNQHYDITRIEIQWNLG